MVDFFFFFFFFFGNFDSRNCGGKKSCFLLYFRQARNEIFAFSLKCDLIADSQQPVESLSPPRFVIPWPGMSDTSAIVPRDLPR